MITTINTVDGAIDFSLVDHEIHYGIFYVMLAMSNIIVERNCI